MNNYQNLEQHFRKIANLQHLEAISSWDQATMMPSGGNSARGDAMAALAVLIHQQTTSPQLGEWFELAAQESLEPLLQASLREMHRVWQNATALPEDLVQARALATSQCEHAWRTQRANNDWQGFAPNLAKVVDLARQEAQVRSAQNGLRPYDALLALYEPDMSCAQIDTLFDDVKSWLPGLIRDVEAKQASNGTLVPQGPFPIAQQQSLGLEVMKLLGFDFEHGRLDISTHPFCGGVPTDVRITTRYDESDFMTAMLGVIHETGHGRYEQNLPKDYAGLPVAHARSMGVHESQSLFFEMQLARGAEFTQVLAPMAARCLGREADPAFSISNMHAFNTRMKRGYIRVNADEITYPAHVILRYEIEQALIEGKIEVDDIPALWDEKMQSLLGLSTEANYRDGCMQDIHWSIGLFGYFPTYTLGAMYAAQQFRAVEKAVPQLREKIARGDLTEMFAWLQKNIWSKASFLSTGELLTSATGEPLNAAYFRQHLERRYLG